MRIKTLLHALARSLLTFVLLATVFLGSCTGLGVAHHESPHLLKKPIAEADARTKNRFFVAFRARDEAGAEQVRAVPYRVLLEHPPSGFESFRLPDGDLKLDANPAETGASVTSRTDGAGVQTTVVHVVGETPWASVSTYEVHGEEIRPVSLGVASPWLLVLAAVLPLLLVYYAQKPVRRLAARAFPGENQ